VGRYFFMVAVTFMLVVTIGCTRRVTQEEGAKLTGVGLFADAPIRVNIGTPCPDSDVPDLDGATQRRTTPQIRSCDYVFLFKEFSGNKIRATTFLYRGAHPPASLRELCQLKYSGNELLPHVGATFDIDFALDNAAKMPRMLSVEEVSKETKHSFLTGTDPKVLSALRANGVRFYDEIQAAKRHWH
jgi:hypothetical protein